MVEHAPAPLLVLGTVIVPVTPLGTGVTVGDAPTCRPCGPTGAPGTVPSEEVTPSEGMTVPTWANAGLQPSKDPTVAIINNGRMEDTPIRAEGLRSERPQGPQAVRQRRRHGSFSWPLTENGLSQHSRRHRRSGDPGVALSGEAQGPGGGAGARARRIAACGRGRRHTSNAAHHPTR